MSIADISKYYTLTDITINPNQMFLDPYNPRILMDCNWDIAIDDRNICDQNIQENIVNIITKNQHHVSHLVDSITSKGFIPQGNSIIVRKIAEERYLVVEGNRRTTAIKHILSGGSPKNDVVDTITQLSVKRYDYIVNDKYTSDQIIDIILGEIHIDGPVSWGAMEKAHYIYKSYIRELKNMYDTERFRYESDVAKKVCTYFNFKAKDVSKSLMIYRVYEQLKRSGYSIKPDKYSLIELVVNNSNIRDAYFEMSHGYNFSENGLELFNILCIDKHCIVKNPSDLNKVIKIYGKRADLVDDIINSEISIDDAVELVNNDLDDNKLKYQLTDLVESLRKLNIGLYQSTDEEVELIEQVIELVNNKLSRLLTDNVFADDDEEDDFILPENIKDAMAVNSSMLTKWVIKALMQRPNRTCMKDKITDVVLQYANIISRGGPRSEFTRKLLQHVHVMIEEGFLEEYKSKNARIRLL